MAAGSRTSSIFRQLLDFALPPRCPACGIIVAELPVARRSIDREREARARHQLGFGRGSLELVTQLMGRRFDAPETAVVVETVVGMQVVEEGIKQQ